MPQSERQIQTGTSMTREMAQDMNAGRIMSIAREESERVVATA